MLTHRARRISASWLQTQAVFCTF